MNERLSVCLLLAAIAPAAWSQAAPAASEPPAPLSVSPGTSAPASTSPNTAPIRAVAPNQEPARTAAPNTAPPRTTAPNTSAPPVTSPGSTAPAGTAGGTTGTGAPTAAECARLRQQFRDAQACFAPYRIVGGGVRPEAFRVCREVADPAPRCGPEVRP